MARKTAREYEKARTRKNSHTLRTTDAESKILKEKAQFCNLNLSTYLLKMGIEGFIVIQDLQTLSRLATEINKIGVNINQIARKVNSNDVVMANDMELLKLKMDDINAMMYKVIDQNILK